MADVCLSVSPPFQGGVPERRGGYPNFQFLISSFKVQLYFILDSNDKIREFVADF